MNQKQVLKTICIFRNAEDLQYLNFIIRFTTKMGKAIHISQKRKVRRNKQKTQQKNITVKAAKYIQDFAIVVTFSTGNYKLIDFLPLFNKHVKGDNLKYFDPQKFKRFIVKNGNIYWGRNEDVIFPVQLLYGLNKKENKTEEEILFVI